MKSLDEALDAYYEHFGRNYPLCIVSLRDNEEIIKDIGRCIDTNTEAEPPKYDEDKIY